MNIVIFSTNSGTFDARAMRIRTVPQCRDDWERTAATHPEHQFFIVTQPPGLFLADFDADGMVCPARNVRYVIAQDNSAQGISDQIAALSPDVAVAASMWTEPFDWHCIKDALVGRLLMSRGIRTVCHSPEAAFTCFDKTRFEAFLRGLGLKVPRSVCVRHELFWCERANRGMNANVYKEYVLEQIRSLTFPVVIKPVGGLSSYGTEVAHTFAEAVHCLRQGKVHSDRLVQEYIKGIQCGTELYGTPGSYVILPPMRFSVTQYGITSPRQGIKAGPMAGDMQLDALSDALCTVATRLGLCGVAQADLIFSGGTWYVLEVNPRLSGMTHTYAAACGTTVSDMLCAIALGKPPVTKTPAFTCNFKLPLLDDATIDRLRALPYVLHLHQVCNAAARQRREQGYCEVIFGATDTPQKLRAQLEDLAARFPALMDAGFLASARDMLGD